MAGAPRAGPRPPGSALAACAPASDLAGEWRRLLQGRDPLDGATHPPDMLFVDCAGGSTAKNDADPIVRRGRRPALGPASAAMALYAFQAHAPSGGAGNRT